MRRLLFVVVFLTAFGFAAGTASAACRSGDPTGYYRGTAQSKEAGALAVAVNLRCDAGSYGGEIETPLGPLPIRDGSYDGTTLTLTFGPDPAGAIGTLMLTFRDTAATGSFRLGADSGTFTVERAGDARAPVSTTPTLALTPAQWREDLRALSETLATRHVAPFAFTTRAAFEREVAALDARIPVLDGDQVYVGLDRLANLIGDGHTYVEFPLDRAPLPITLRRFGDDFRIVATAGENRALAGLRVTAIGGVAVRRVHDALLAMTPVGETDLLRDVRATGFLTLGMALHGFGFTPDRNTARIEVADDAGNRRSLDVRALTPAEAAMTAYTPVWTRAPLYRTRPNEDFWFTYLPDAATVYCSFRGYNDLETNAAALLAFVREHRTRKLAIDLRQNGGGDFNAGLRFLIEPIRRMAAIDRRGALFVLVGPSTFSAAMSNAAQFRTLTHAFLVGEPIGERPNSAQEPNQSTLPNSHLVVRYSTKRYVFAPRGPNAIVPDIVVAPTWAQYRAGEDPVLDAVLRYPSGSLR